MIRKIRFTNIGPFRHFETVCGQAMIVTADNGEGKTTFLSAISSLLDDHNSDLITIGEEEAEAYFEFANGMTVTQTITKRGSKYDIRMANGEKVLKRHKEFLQSLVTGFSLNPMKLLHCSKDERIDYLLKAMPIWFPADAVAALGFPKPDGDLNLEQFDSRLAGAEADRTAQNKTVDATKGMLSRLESSLPSGDAEAKDWQKEAASLQGALSDAKSSLDGYRTSEEQKWHSGIKTLDLQTNNALEEAKRQYERQVAAIKSIAAEERSNRQRECQANIERESILRKPEIESLATALTLAQERARNQAQMEGLRNSVQQARAQFREESQEATRRQKLVEAMREMRRSRLGSLPIEGIEIRGKELYVDGKNFDTALNAAEQVRVAFQISAQGANTECPIMIADGGDLLNETNLGWIAEAAENGGFQVFITKRNEKQKGLRVIPYSEYKAELEHAA